MKASDYIAKFLIEKGVKSVFELSGGMIMHLIHSIEQSGKIKLVSVHHEQGAAFAADAMGRMTGIPGVAMATSGPGATNLLTGIGSCYFDSSPAVFITGQVNRHEQKGERQVRQLGFQETDIVTMAHPITKAAWRVKAVEELPRLLEEAFVLAVEGRPGPVLIDIPMDVQRAEINPPSAIERSSEKASPIDPAFWQQFFAAITKAKRPMILVGGGIRSGRAAELFRKFAAQIRIPVVHSLMAVDVLPYSDPLRVGMIGSYGNRWANLSLGKSDCLIVLGSRLDVRQTGSETKAFKGERPIYHVDCETGEINNRVVGCTAIVNTMKDFLTAACVEAEKYRFEEHNEWLNEIGELRNRFPDDKELSEVPGINPNHFMHLLGKSSAQAAAFVVDVGQHQMWAAQSLELSASQRFLTSGGMGSMGFSLPAAVGVAFAASNQPVVVVAGDGGFQCNIQELQTVVRNGLPVKMVIINNQCHGMVRQFQESYFDKRYPSTLWGYSAPDFAKIGTAYGIASRTISAESEMADALKWLWENPSEPALLNVFVDTYANAYPKIAFGFPITEMEPLVKPIEMEGT
jgi:acetolactate synthase I/II/III large subunit